MNITISELIQNYGFDSVLIAATVCILTGLIKMPIKSLASKTKNSKKYTKYITFLPLFLGFGVTVLYEYILTKKVLFTVDFMTLWLTSSSLSLAIYAFIEKFIPNKKEDIVRGRNQTERGDARHDKKFFNGGQAVRRNRKKHGNDSRND